MGVAVRPDRTWAYERASSRHETKPVEAPPTATAWTRPGRAPDSWPSGPHRDRDHSAERRPLRAVLCQRVGAHLVAGPLHHVEGSEARLTHHLEVLVLGRRARHAADVEVDVALELEGQRAHQHQIAHQHPPAWLQDAERLAKHLR